jgi:hypothetical protein
MITIQKVTSNVQSVPRQSPDIYWHAELCSRRPCSVKHGPHSKCILWWSSSNHQLCGDCSNTLSFSSHPREQRLFDHPVSKNISSRVGENWILDTFIPVLGHGLLVSGTLCRILFVVAEQPLIGPWPPHCWDFDITLSHTTRGRTPLDEGSALRRDIYLTTHRSYNRHPCTPGGFQTHNPNRRAAAGPRFLSFFLPFFFLSVGPR